ncbi:uncharacterized protein [Dendropsophus ebraccatus]|uniref:uncharacterized protein n=1 Tax=Dendropsophus ebraccatus TaxID=150705 RepID=UPI003831CECE
MDQAQVSPSSAMFLLPEDPCASSDRQEESPQTSRDQLMIPSSEVMRFSNQNVTFEDWPEMGTGWKIKTCIRKSGKLAGQTYKTYKSPTGQTFRSLKEVERYNDRTDEEIRNVFHLFESAMKTESILSTSSQQDWYMIYNTKPKLVDIVSTFFKVARNRLKFASQPLFVLDIVEEGRNLDSSPQWSYLGPGPLPGPRTLKAQS